jgi:TonB-linked SusC/RagA family outer membrane protein
MYKIYTKDFCMPPGYIHKTLLIMKLTIFILIISLMQVSATTFGQKLTLTEKNISMEKVFREIRKQTGYDVLIENTKFKTSQRMNANFKETPLEQVLSQIVKGTSLTYVIEDKTVVLKEENEPSFLDNLIDRFNSIDVRGIVVDENGSPLSGATIRVKGTNKSISSNNRGEFNLQDVNETATIVISYLGYETKEIGAEEELGTIKLTMSSSSLDEIVINKGYYSENKRLSTASVGQVTAEEIGRQPVSNPLQALYAKVPGLIVKQSTGVQGAGIEIEIRGQNSLRKTASDNGNIPLYIVDGIPFSSVSLKTGAAGSLYPAANQYAPGASPFNSLNPSDIESIEILKDADATAIYGSRGANGVVLITTKKGNIGALKVDLNFYSGAGEVTRKSHVLNTEQYVMMRKEAFKNSGTEPQPEEYDMNGTWSQTANTDWQKELIGGTSNIIDAQAGISGGSINSQYRVSGGFHRETTVFPGDFSDQRVSGSLSLSNKSPNQKFKSQIIINYSLGNADLLRGDLTASAIKLAPNHPALMDSNGELIWSEDGLNVLSSVKSPYNANSSNLMTNANFNYEFIKGLSLITNVGYTASSRKEISKRFKSFSAAPEYQMYYDNLSYFGNSFNNSWIIEPQISWQRTFSLSNVNVIMGGTFQEQQAEGLFQTAKGFATEALMDNISSVPSANITNSFTGSEYRYNAVFARIHYDYKNTYLLNLTGRRDGSSRFGPGKQFANFGALGVAWVFSNETFFKDKLSFLNFGKLRGSYGSAGSDQTNNYGFLDLYITSIGYQGIRGLGPKQLFNPDYAWEINKKIEAAVELGFFKDRLLFTTAYYRNRSSNQLVGYALPPTAGFETIQKNLAAVVQNTGLEIEINSVNLKTSSLTWNSSVNVSFPKNKLVAYPNLQGSSYANTYIIGEPISIRRLFKSSGVDPATGFHQVEDVDKNGMYNTTDRTQNIFIGQQFYGGLTNSFQWKGLQLDVMFQFVKQNGPTYLYDFGYPGFGENVPVEVLKRWQKPGDVTNIQKFQNVDFDAYSNFLESDAAVADASYIRLKNLSLAYKIPASLIKQSKINALRIYVQGQNLLTITNYGGLDPESQGWVLPPLRFLTAGLQLTL